jgi:gamma-glutamylcyclotransferase (GGCT)/AIG2-like uncharacterized protein YtfP
MASLFAYGTLQFPNIMRKVTGRVFAGQAARLEHYRRHCLQGQDFPGIAPLQGGVVEGLLFAAVDGESLAKLDAYEGDFYRRESLQVIDAQGVAQSAEVYVTLEKFHYLLSEEDWRLEAFGLGFSETAQE